MARTNLKLALILILALCINGCTRTTLNPPPLPERILRMAELNDRPLAIVVENQTKGTTVGYQYGLLLLPLGRVVAPELENHVSQALFQALALKGYRPHLPHSTLAPPSVTVKVSVQQISVSAYDYLFMRRIVCRVQLSGQLLNAQGHVFREGAGFGEKRISKVYAFAPQLEWGVEQAISQSVTNLLLDLRL